MEPSKTLDRTASAAPASAEGSDAQCPGKTHLANYTYQELEEATDKFSEQNIVSDKSSLGIVYRGRLPSGDLIAVKKSSIPLFAPSGPQLFSREVQVAKSVLHPNLLPLTGICKLESEWILVYPLGSNLKSRLHKRPEGQPPLDWETRKRIALGLARGLAYLHEKGIVLRDIYTGSIWLDESLEPRIGDYSSAKFMDGVIPEACQPEEGLSAEEPVIKLLDFDDDTSGWQRLGYTDPDCINSGYSWKSDVYSYGVVLLELISAGDPTVVVQHSPSIYKGRVTEGFYIPSYWVKPLEEDAGNLLESKIDSSMINNGGNYSKSEVEGMIKLALICKQLHSPEKRPSMPEVVSILQGNGGSLDMRWEEFLRNFASEEQIAVELNGMEL
ncbi:hypothetical protein SAY87_017683 [Trapa incisa]|uniref:Protein kinase domain-containing protein n=1 Tax=Trapa incisa TaxID=236973 RepID=A0AAN7QUG8_9MYRT|nr:hypothetical protein SAY87_017683 [Trapa incisa]